MHKKSDIDILLIFDTKHDPELGEEGTRVHKIAGEIEKHIIWITHFLLYLKIKMKI